MDNRDKAVAAANRAKELALGEGGLFEIFDAVERLYSQRLFETEPTDSATREAIYHRVNAFRDIRDVLKSAIARGAGAETKIRRLSEIKTRVA